MNAITARLTTVKDFLATQHWPTLFDLKNLWRWSYWSERPVPTDSPYIFITAIVTGLIVAGLLIWWIQLRRLHQKYPVYALLLDQIPTLLIFIVVVSLVYAFCRAQDVQYLSSRLVVLAEFIVSLGWFGYLLFYTARVIPAKRQSHLEKERFFRYLPKSKKNG